MIISCFLQLIINKIFLLNIKTGLSMGLIQVILGCCGKRIN